jgi:hypothetical protein
MDPPSVNLYLGYSFTNNLIPLLKILQGTLFFSQKDLRESLLGDTSD